jgi:micrococcal nuclease
VTRGFGPRAPAVEAPAGRNVGTRRRRAATPAGGCRRGRGLIGLAGSAALVAATHTAAGRAAAQHRVGARIGHIDYAVDGDTLRVEVADRELVYVRLVSIDTPEDVKPGTPVECGSKAAAASMRGLAPEGAEVLLRPDSVADGYDRYGRLLAHAFVDGRQLELVQLRRGWAEVYRYDEQRFDGLARFDAVQTSARRADGGVWGHCGGDFHSSR